LSYLLCGVPNCMLNSEKSQVVNARQHHLDLLALRGDNHTPAARHTGTKQGPTRREQACQPVGVWEMFFSLSHALHFRLRSPVCFSSRVMSLRNTKPPYLFPVPEVPWGPLIFALFFAILAPGCRKMAQDNPKTLS